MCVCVWRGGGGGEELQKRWRLNYGYSDIQNWKVLKNKIKEISYTKISHYDTIVKLGIHSRSWTCDKLSFTVIKDIKIWQDVWCGP